MRWTALLVLAMTAGCARLDHVQIGSIDQTQGELVPVSVRLSETGFDATAAAEIGRIASRGQAAERLKQIRNILAMVNMGPRTGNPVYNEAYAQRLQEYLLVECPTGRLTGIRAIREAKAAGPVSGEIVGVDAYCIR